MRSFIVSLLAVPLVLTGLSGAVSATSGFGCYRVNVGPNDPLRIRNAPRAGAAVVASYHWNDQPIIALDAPGLPRGEGVQPELFDVWRAEFDACVPEGRRPVGSRWCPVTIFDGGGSRRGWLKRRFVDYAECP